MSNAEESQPQSEPVPSDAVSDSDQPPEASKKSRIAEWVAGLRWKAHWMAPNLIPHPHRGDRAYEETHDREVNEKSRVPTEHQLRCGMVWGVELYGPSEIESLYQGMTKLDWARIGSHRVDDRAANRIREMRSESGGAWMNLDPVFPAGTKTPSLLSRNFAPLPNGVESLLVRVFQITPSLTAVLIGFRLNDSLANCYENEINSDRKTFRRRSHRPHAIERVGPWNQKHEAVASVRSELRRMVGDWFSHYLPGYFCDLKRPSEFPAMELLIAQTSILEDTKESSHRGWMEWRRLLANSAPHELWSDEETPGLQLAYERHHDQQKGLHIIAALDTKTFPEEKTKHVGGSQQSSYTWLCHEFLDGILLHSATIEYLKEHMRDLNRTRERMKKARSGRKNASRTLDEIGRFFDRILGFPAIARELAKHSENVDWYRHDCNTFTAPGWSGGERSKLHEAICRQVRFLSSQLTEEEASLRGHFEQLTTILSVRESMKAQRRMELMTVFAIFVAIGSLIVALPRLDETTKRVEAFWRSAVSAIQK